MFSAIWFLPIWTAELHEKILILLGKICLSSLFSKINWSYNRHDVFATIWDQKFMLKSDLYCPDRLHLGVKMKVSSMASTWCIQLWHTIYRHQTKTQILTYIIKYLHWSLWMAHGNHVYHLCESCKQTYYRSIIRSPSNGRHQPLLFDVCHYHDYARQNT